nr:hypothetical protein Iba_chr04bCG10900 [Ipomoea batatas]GMC86317.1 hypothetical protein Iba_chr04dCG9770 [Ipomoea batatas]
MKSRPVTESTIGSKQSWKIATASASRTLVSREVILPLRSLHLKSISPIESIHFSTSFALTISKQVSGNFSSPELSKFCSAKYILWQSVQQNHLPSGSSCGSAILCFFKQPM